MQESEFEAVLSLVERTIVKRPLDELKSGSCVSSRARRGDLMASHRHVFAAGACRVSRCRERQSPQLDQGWQPLRD
jgi:hypothetical protein